MKFISGYVLAVAIFLDRVVVTHPHHEAGDGRNDKGFVTTEVTKEDYPYLLRIGKKEDRADADGANEDQFATLVTAYAVLTLAIDGSYHDVQKYYHLYSVWDATVASNIFDINVHNVDNKVVYYLEMYKVDMKSYVDAGTMGFLPSAPRGKNTYLFGTFESYRQTILYYDNGLSDNSDIGSDNSDIGSDNSDIGPANSDNGPANSDNGPANSDNGRNDATDMRGVIQMRRQEKRKITLFNFSRELQWLSSVDPSFEYGGRIYKVAIGAPELGQDLFIPGRPYMRSVVTFKFNNVQAIKVISRVIHQWITESKTNFEPPEQS